MCTYLRCVSSRCGFLLNAFVVCGFLQVLYYVRSFKHFEALWFANVGNQVRHVLLPCLRCNRDMHCSTACASWRLCASKRLSCFMGGPTAACTTLSSAIVNNEHVSDWLTCHGQVLWWTYVKACWRAVGSVIAKKGITFKTTMKVRSAVHA